jgi:type VI protein secretion system component VasK
LDAHAAIINDELAQLAVYHNVMRMSKARDRWAENQADETAWGQRKYRGRRRLPMRLALHGTLSHFDAYVARLHAALRGGAAPRFHVLAEALQSLDALA